MDVVTTSLEALIQRVTNPQNQKPDIAATEAFCVMLTKESEGIQIGAKLLALHIQSCNESEALQALTLLDTCMRSCGPSFHAEIGKFRFLNEMVRLVSPKYLGGRTPVMVRQKVLQLLHTWTKEYPQEIKIKETYEMLKKQGVIEDEVTSTISASEDSYKIPKTKNTLFDDEEKSKLLQKLLQSKNPDDLQAANRLIKTMVREDEKRVQLNSRRIMELESVHNNAKLLSEMLDSYNRNETNAEDLDLMKELHQACERLKPVVMRLANETQDNEEMLGDVLAANDELEQVFEKYSAVIIRGECAKPKTDSTGSPYLLDLSSPMESVSIENAAANASYDTAALNHRSDMEVLGDIFNSIGKSTPLDTSSICNANLLLHDNSAIMQPINVLPTNKKDDSNDTPERKVDSKAKALEELNELGESLLKQSLLSSTISNARSNSGSKQTINRISNIEHSTEQHPAVDAMLLPHSNSSNFSAPLDIANSMKTGQTDDFQSLIDRNLSANDTANSPTIAHQNTDEKLNTTECNNRVSPTDTISAATIPKDCSTVNAEPEIKTLSDINVNLQDIKPGISPPITVIEEKNGISVVLHFARDNPRKDVFVVVVMTMSKNVKPLSNYLFQAVVPKVSKENILLTNGNVNTHSIDKPYLSFCTGGANRKCKCRLQPPSGTDLPGHNPFLPPSAITQILLIRNPAKETVSLKFMLSYTMDNETFTEMGEVEKLPLV